MAVALRARRPSPEPVSGADRRSARARVCAWPSCGANTSSTCCTWRVRSRSSGPRMTCPLSSAARLVYLQRGRRIARCCCSTASSDPFLLGSRLRMIRRRRKGRAREQHVGRVANLQETPLQRAYHGVPSTRPFHHVQWIGTDSRASTVRGHARRRLADPHTFASFVPVRLRRQILAPACQRHRKSR